MHYFSPKIQANLHEKKSENSTKINLTDSHIEKKIKKFINKKIIGENKLNNTHQEKKK